ncbi:hypothetical protein KIH86_03995 [Paenibacillus sp. HN-1]|uniref:hypothetical protein n=1 Tax=Paenibacillus TaxID=44249 RepID=UPI001CA889EF|nr:MULTISPECIES: hypothetical protein [Paenibacillus]MBY9082607.1 hypothetical protein [Paenibacillus sp. CGMCC 1.18879]MBY9083389.1 hypothetical protein [Paenibacillus sinensis]
MGYGMPKDAAETTIRVPHVLKDDLNALKDKLYASTPHEAVRRLIEYREKAESEKMKAKAYQDANMLDVGQDAKVIFQQLKDELGLRTDGAVIGFLANCYWGQLQIPVSAFEVYKQLRKDGK